MSYLVFARKLRPQRFTDLIGQEAIYQTLINAIKTGRVAHAFLFTGPRGTGKTSCARILTKALNCQNPVDAEPCNQCEPCKEISAGISADVMEIDAASNRGIEHIRELRESVKFSPAKGNYKTYIIDEVHMLTTESFNALLKTLEEPPSHVKFILATTDPHKIPNTVVSRCQRFDFAYISQPKMVDYLAQVATNEGLKISSTALGLIARASTGGMRDALTTLDMLVSFSGTDIPDEAVVSLLGLSGAKEMDLLLDALIHRDLYAALDGLEAQMQRGRALDKLLSELMTAIKDLSLVKELPAEKLGWRHFLPEQLEHYQQLAQDTSSAALQQIFQILLETEAQMKRSAQAKLALEMAMVKICALERVRGLAEILGLLEGARDPQKKTELHRPERHRPETPEPAPQQPSPIEPEASEEPVGPQRQSFSAAPLPPQAEPTAPVASPKAPEEPSASAGPLAPEAAPESAETPPNEAPPTAQTETVDQPPADESRQTEAPTEPAPEDVPVPPTPLSPEPEQQAAPPEATPTPQPRDQAPSDQPAPEEGPQPSEPPAWPSDEADLAPPSPLEQVPEPPDFVKHDPWEREEEDYDPSPEEMGQAPEPMQPHEPAPQAPTEPESQPEPVPPEQPPAIEEGQQAMAPPSTDAASPAPEAPAEEPPQGQASPLWSEVASVAQPPASDPPVPESPVQAPPASTQETGATSDEPEPGSWPHFVARFALEQAPVLLSQLKSSVPLAFGPELIQLGHGNPAMFRQEHKDQLLRFATQYFGQTPKLEIHLSDQGKSQSLSAQEQQARSQAEEAARQAAAQDPQVKAVQEVFPQSNIKQIYLNPKKE